MLIHHDWQQLMPTDGIETSIPPDGQAPQLPTPFYHWKEIRDLVRTREEDGEG